MIIPFDDAVLIKLGKVQIALKKFKTGFTIFSTNPLQPKVQMKVMHYLIAEGFVKEIKPMNSSDDSCAEA